MNPREKRLVTVGLLFGVAAAAAVYEAKLYFTARGKAPGTLSQTAATEPAPAPQTTEETTSSPIAIALTPDEQKLIGVEIAEVQRQTVRKEIVAPGKVVEPETGIGTISARISGRIEKLFLNVTGESVSRGAPVASIYSPAVFAMAEEYKLAVENRERLKDSKEPKAIAQADELIQASRRRLELSGLTPQQIESITPTAAPSLQLMVYSPIEGIVTKRNVAEGQYVNEGDILFTVTDLSTVWVQADVFESDIAAVRNGMDARITSPALAGRTLRGTINFLQPAVDPQTRTMSARIQVPNPGMRLRPGMFVQVALNTLLASDAVAVPRAAVINTGTEQVVYVPKENGIFEKRIIEAIAAGDDYYAVVKGLSPGERVVTQGNFLIDSQTRLTGNITGMFGGSKAFGADAQSPPGSASNFKVRLRPEPSPRKGGSAGMFHVTVTGPDGKPVSDAQVQVTLVMPAMPAMGMGEMRSSISLAWNGTEYSGSGPIAMAGSWNVTVEARRNGQLLGVDRSRFDAK